MSAITCRSYPKSWCSAAILSMVDLDTACLQLLGCLKRVLKDAYLRFILNVLQSPAGIFWLSLFRKPLNSGINFGVTVAAHLQAFSFKLNRIRYNTKYAGSVQSIFIIAWSKNSALVSSSRSSGRFLRLCVPHIYQLWL